MGAPMPPDLRAQLNRAHPAEWAIECPGCHAKPGTACRSPKRRPVPGDVHPSRADAWLLQQHAA
jgi:hypothetical protein